LILRHKSLYEKAVEDFTRALDIDSNYSWVYFDRGVTYEMQCEGDKAVDDLSKAMAVDPFFSWTYYHRAGAYLQLGKVQKAILDMKAAAELGNQEAKNCLRDRER
jgi:tetratricopeptide (TPR) repeat protein